MTEQQQLEAAIAALEGQRSTLGDAVVESLLAAARAKLAGHLASAAALSVKTTPAFSELKAELTEQVRVEVRAAAGGGEVAPKRGC